MVLSSTGAYGTAAADYDYDGDIDFASIGYYAAHLNRDKELFIYFKDVSADDKKWQFAPHGFRGKKDDTHNSNPHENLY